LLIRRPWEHSGACQRKKSGLLEQDLSGREPKKRGGLYPEQPGALLVTLLAQVVVLYVGPDSLGHLRGGNLLALAAAQHGS